MSPPATTPTRSSAKRSQAAVIFERVLSEHRLLRHRLDVLELAVDGLCEEPARRGAVKRAARDLLQRLIVHTQHEDASLAPVLENVDAWRDASARTLLEHHAAQREELTSLIDSYERSDESLSQLALRTRAWIDEVRADMDHEERALLRRELLDAFSASSEGEAVTASHD